MSDNYVGQLIVVKDAYGRFLVRRISSIARMGVFVWSEEEWKKHYNGFKTIEPLGFPKEDCFMYPADNSTFTSENGILLGGVENSLIPFCEVLL